MSTIPLFELKRRHETGDKLNKGARRAINEQLKRECIVHGCHESLAFTRKSMFICETHKKTHKVGSDGKSQRVKGFKKTSSYEQRKMNREKKKRFYEKHGIKFEKTIRNRKSTPGKQAIETGTAREYQGEDLIYENYKEPLKRIEPTKGFGYYGTIGQTSDKKYVQCHVCGHLFSTLGGHLRKHKVTSEKYKEMFKLAATATLQSEEQRIKQQELVITKKLPKKGELPEWLKTYNKDVQTGKRKHPGTKRREGGMSMQRRNELGICPDQVLLKIKDLADILGRAPSELEFKAHYKGRFYSSITYQHGSYLKAIKKLGMKSAKELKEHTRESLIEAMVEFHEVHGRTPMTSDFKRGLLPSRGAYFRYFGTLNNARIEAGLNAILPMPFGQIIEMSPDQYIEYKLSREK